MEKEKKKFNLKVIIPIVITIIVILGGFIFYKTSDLSKDFYYFLQDGEYEKAYEKAKNDNEKQEIIQQNAVAYVCKLAFQNNVSLSVGTKLENAWYDTDKRIVLYLSNEDYNTNNELYLYFTYKEEIKDYEWVCGSKAPILEENITLSKDYSSTATNSKYANIGNSFLKQSAVNKMNEIMTSKNQIQSRTIGNVNRYFSLAILDTVELFKTNE